ncbi:GNAT family N-acetyltransferase [Butyrivibrio sp. INlla16]|uniref:GNAT family N-acetyltransferase n=1 Tax=Butyrivibrio sp. INlla16 TaxID=1520807 RepID=UPI000883AA06|nr:GNAT family N-acetyltransferase [Butyrivibrio sp. INlla16]SDB63064.1 Acetyltransferase (GNAT) domain-containing protein [Butyrivibrio sp. INlla16]
MKHTYCLENEKICIRPMSPEDSEKYRVLRNRKDNIGFFFSGTEITSDQQAAWYTRYLADETQYMFSIYETDSDQFIGGIGIYDIDEIKGQAEVGRIIVDKELAAGKHYGAEAIKLIEKMARDEIGLKILYANIYSDNIPSLKSFYGAGFVEISEDQGITKVIVEIGE